MLLPAIAFGQTTQPAPRAAAPGVSPTAGATQPVVASSTQPIRVLAGLDVNLPETIRLYLPDPTEASEAFRRRLETYRDDELRTEFENIVQLAMQIMRELERPQAMRLSLHEATRRALLHSYAIRVEGYNPAVEAARVVEAEARFDAAFFLNFQQNVQDQPTAPATTSQLGSLLGSLGGDTDTTGGIPASILSLLQPQARGTKTKNTTFQGGLRKLLASGAQVRTGYEANRLWTSSPVTTLNPAYTNSLFFEISQPLLRGFGLDVTKAEIRLRQLDQEIAQQRYVRQVQQTVRQVEQSYWNLVAARRNLPILAELVAQTEQVLRYFEIRRQFDVQPVQIANTQARLAARRAELISLLNQIGDAETRLKALMNDPSLPIPSEVAIVPTAIPAIDAVLLNRLVEIKTALDNRPELAEARTAVQSARVGVTVANNQRLPQLDLLFRYTVSGLGGNADSAFDQLTEHDFVDYLVGVQFEWPIGNRAAEAVYRQSRLRLAQSIASVKQAIEQVIAEVDVAYRNIETLYREMLPNAAAVVAQADNLRAIQQRADRRDPTFLDLELSTQEGLRTARQALLNTWVQYSVGIVNLELAKGTLLVYDNIRLEPRQTEEP